MAAEGRGTASFDRTHDAPFGAAEVAGMCLAIRLAVAAEYIRHLERRHDRSSSVWRRFRQLQPVERAGCVADHGGCDLGIACRGRQMLMAEQHLDRADIGAGFEQMGGKAVTQRMDTHRLSELRRLASIPARPVERAYVERVALVAAREQPVFRSDFLPIGAQHDEQLCGQHDVPVPMPLPCSTRISMRLLSISAIRSCTTSET